MKFFGLFSRIFALIYLTSTPKMVYDMFKTVITFPLIVNMQTSFRSHRWGKTPPCSRFAPGAGVKRPIFFPKLKIDF